VSKPVDVTLDLRIGEVDDSELAVVLSSVLPRGAQFRPTEVEYRNANDECALALTYRAGKIVAAHAGPAMRGDLLETIIEAISRALLGDQVTKICRWTLFSSRPVEGHWRYRDELQIVPAPVDAPRPPYLMAQHPFILDFQFTDSSDFVVRQSRYLRRAADSALIFNLLLNSRIDSPLNRGKKHWVFIPSPDATPEVVWAQEGYMIPNFQYIVADLPAPSAREMDRQPADDYFDRRSPHQDTLAVPSEIDELYAAFVNLSREERERFLRACFWYRTSFSVWHDAQSLTLTSLVNAVESLSGARRDKLDPEGATGLFIDFMKEWAPASPSASQLNRIYKARSEISHGERLLHLDQSSQTWGLSQQWLLDREVGEDATILVRGALINWLRSQVSTSGHIINKGLETGNPLPRGTKSETTVISPS
jgi:hypothetical protein